MEYLAEYGLFAAKTITIVVAILVVIVGLVATISRQRRPPRGKLEIEHLNKGYERAEKRITSALRSEHESKLHAKAERKRDKAEAKAAKKGRKGEADADADKGRLFVIDFDGDIRASAVKQMREEITAILTVATPADEVLVRLESTGGLVYSYGLAASQLQRFREAQIPLTVAIDKVAASGGYMMACVANKILAAPFSMVGSIGVIAQVPNLHRLLKKHDIDVEQHYAGEYKRTLTLLGENTDKGREKLREELEETHRLFQEFIAAGRPKLDVARIATGETWLGTRALELGLVDEIQTSDAYLMAARDRAEIMRISYKERKGVMGSVGSLALAALRQRETLERESQAPLLM